MRMRTANERLQFDATTADIDIDKMIVDPAHEGIALLVWGVAIPRIGDRFEFVEEDGTRYELLALRYHPRSPTPRMRRHHERPDYWLTVRLERLLAFQLALPFEEAR